MTYVFFGSPEFAEIVLGKLLDANLVPVAVVCNPDRPVGRKKIITSPLVKQLITKNSQLQTEVQILQPESLTSYVLRLKSFEPDLFIVAAYAKIIPKEILTIPRLGTIGVHPSLLPKYRGASPIQSAILAGESETGVTLYLVDEKVDHGAIIAQKKYEIGNKNYEELEKGLAELGGELLVETLSKFSSGAIGPEVQDESKATFTKKFVTEDGFVSPELLEKAEGVGDAPAFEIDRKIRALNPEPGVYTLREGKRVKLLEARIENGRLKLTKIQKEGGKPVSIS